MRFSSSFGAASARANARRGARVLACIPVVVLVALALECSSSAWAQSAQTASVQATDASKDELERQKLKAEIAQIQARNSVAWAPLAEPVGSVASAVTALVAVLGIVVGGLRWRTEFHAGKERRDDERFASVLHDLGDGHEPTRAGAALMLRRFFDKPHSRIHQQAFDATVSALRQYGPQEKKQGEVLTTLRHALITAFAEGAPIHRAGVARKVRQLRNGALGATRQLDKVVKEHREGLQQRYLNASGVQLAGAFLWKADFQGIYMTDACLREADLSHANLQSAMLWGSLTDLYKAKLYGARLDGANLGSAHLAEARLDGAKLPRALLDGARLQKASLNGCDLTDASLRTANLSRAKLRRAILVRADLTKAELQGAELQGAELRGADLTNAKLDGANFERARYNSEAYEDEDGESVEPTRWPNGKPPPLALDVSPQARGSMAQPV